MSISRAAAVCAVLGLPLTFLHAQGLVVSTALDVAVPGGFALQEELHRLDAGGRTAAMPLEVLNILAGDADGNLAFDDGPTNIDAAHWVGGTGPESFLLSTTANFTAATATGNVQILDGDVFQFTATGVQVVYAEAFFQSAAGTTAIDVDAFAIGPAGELYFSFAEDETTSVAALIAANGGVALLDEQCVFRLDAGAATAVLHFTQAQVVSIFNAACGTSGTTVVDVDGVEVDPNHPGELLMTATSSAAAIKGRVVSSFGGGQIFFMGLREAGPSGFDFATPTSLDALAYVPLPAAPILRAAQQTMSVASNTIETLSVSGFAPAEMLQYTMTDALLPRPVFSGLPGFGGYAATPLELTSPLLATTMTLPSFQRTADGFGSASLSFSVAGLPPFVHAAVQVLGMSGKLSTPVVITLLP